MHTPQRHKSIGLVGREVIAAGLALVVVASVVFVLALGWL